LTHLGQYHSHPATENFPSPTDIEQACYPDQAYFIISLRPDAPIRIRAFSIRDGAVQEIEILVTRTKE
jgi:proteasome lid subunit RPN8/RPN11